MYIRELPNLNSTVRHPDNGHGKALITQYTISSNPQNTLRQNQFQSIAQPHHKDFRNTMSTRMYKTIDQNPSRLHYKVEYVDIMNFNQEPKEKKMVPSKILNTSFIFQNYPIKSKSSCRKIYDRKANFIRYIQQRQQKQQYNLDNLKDTLPSLNQTILISSKLQDIPTLNKSLDLKTVSSVSYTEKTGTAESSVANMSIRQLYSLKQKYHKFQPMLPTSKAQNHELTEQLLNLSSNQMYQEKPGIVQREQRAETIMEAKNKDPMWISHNENNKSSNEDQQRHHQNHSSINQNTNNLNITQNLSPNNRNTRNLSLYQYNKTIDGSSSETARGLEPLRVYLLKQKKPMQQVTIKTMNRIREDSNSLYGLSQALKTSMRKPILPSLQITQLNQGSLSIKQKQQQQTEESYRSISTHYRNRSDDRHRGEDMASIKMSQEEIMMSHSPIKAIVKKKNHHY